LKESKAGKSVQSQHDKQRLAFDADLGQKRKAFEDQVQKLAAQKSTSNDEFKRKRDALIAHGKAVEQSLVKAKQALDSNFNKALRQIRSALLEIIADIAKKRALTLVPNKSAGIMAADAYDFTDESMKELDAKFPSVKLKDAN
jgi:Skp family chaperone for outer membrane proteins